MEVTIREMQFCVNLILKEKLKVTTNTIYLLVINYSVIFLLLIWLLVSVHYFIHLTTGKKISISLLEFFF